MATYPNNKRRRKRWPQHVVPGRRGGGRCDRASRSRRYQEGGAAADTAFADPPPTAAAAPPAAAPASGSAPGFWDQVASYAQTLDDLNKWGRRNPMTEFTDVVTGGPIQQVTPSMERTKAEHPYLTTMMRGVGPLSDTGPRVSDWQTVASRIGSGLRSRWRGNQ
jgi:hypothetical protein